MLRPWNLKSVVVGAVSSLLLISISVRAQTSTTTARPWNRSISILFPPGMPTQNWGYLSIGACTRCPGWAPLSHPNHDFSSQDYIKNNPYAEWYLNVMRIDGSPTQAYHREHYGADYDYYNFAPVFDREIQKWKPEAWAKVFRDAGAKYVVLTTKHHDGFTLWPSATPNPTLPADRQHATRDIVGDLSKAVRAQGLRMGLYYSGGYDWTFVPGPIREEADYQKVKPQSEAYGKYADAHVRELIERYHPALLWNDIDYPKSGHPLELMAEYYNAVPDGVIDDRFGVKHSDFRSPEYEDWTRSARRSGRSAADWDAPSVTTAPKAKRRPSLRMN